MFYKEILFQFSTFYFILIVGEMFKTFLSEKCFYTNVFPIMHLGMNHWIRYICFAVFEMYLHCCMPAFVVGLSNLLFCDIWS